MVGPGLAIPTALDTAEPWSRRSPAARQAEAARPRGAPSGRRGCWSTWASTRSASTATGFTFHAAEQERSPPATCSCLVGGLVSVVGSPRLPRRRPGRSRRLRRTELTVRSPSIGDLLFVWTLPRSPWRNAASASRPPRACTPAPPRSSSLRTTRGVPVTIARPAGRAADARSLLTVLALDVRHGEEVVLRADGDGAESADRLASCSPGRAHGTGTGGPWPPAASPGWRPAHQPPGACPATPRRARNSP